LTDRALIVMQVWDVSNGKAVFSVKKGAPVTDHFSPFSARLAWHPDGSVLAAPGVDVRHGHTSVTPTPFMHFSHVLQ
jgi:WD40 repeat protein